MTVNDSCSSSDSFKSGTTAITGDLNKSMLYYQIARPFYCFKENIDKLSFIVAAAARPAVRLFL